MRLMMQGPVMSGEHALYVCKALRCFRNSAAAAAAVEKEKGRGLADGIYSDNPCFGKREAWGAGER